MSFKIEGLKFIKKIAIIIIIARQFANRQMVGVNVHRRSNKKSVASEK